MPAEEFDVFAELPPNDPESDVETILRRLGWEGFLSLGDSNSDLYVQTYRRSLEGRTEYMLEVGDVNATSPYIKVGTFVELMDLLARWAPAVQAASVTAVLTEVRDYGLSESGTVEMIAAKAAWGADSGRDRLQRWQRDRDEQQRQIAAERKAARQAT